MSARLDVSQRPLLVFWETTRACQLACRHCRADAIAQALPGELTSLQCGGSRARAFAASGDPLGEDPGCAYVPRLDSA